MPHTPRNLNLDDALLEEAFRLSGRRTKREAVNAVLVEYVARRKRRRIFGLFGSLDWDQGFDHEKERERR